MSEQQTQKGKIRLVENIEGETTYEKKAIELLFLMGKDDAWIKEYVEDCGWEGALSEACYDNKDGLQYMIINEKIYEVLEEEELSSYGYAEVTKNEDGTFSYLASWYNGGASIEEVLENKLFKLE